ncbi:doublesex- and mab-3-related transcription factor C1-like [Rattus norvegicus]|uniref:DMRT-like family C1c1 n=2 Tax=Rattus norvegicus TaxID=10116 RepID=A0A8I6GKM7_RAT|nr:DMRT-like family C1c [Rattus norvegicus]XP_038956380.1 doublesex- and mab-3-related transcription factor C1-like [Rattus norvegicus]|eukprot:NP_001014244.2 DMRT-like family C1c [Rattus norvegicus]
MGNGTEEAPSTPPGPSASSTGSVQPPWALPQPLQRATISRLPAGLGLAREQMSLRTMEPKDKPAVPCRPSTSEYNMGNRTAAALPVMEPRLRGHTSHAGRGHSCGSRIQVREQGEALLAVGSEKKGHSAPIKRRQIRLPRTTVPRKPLKQAKKTSTKGRGRTAKENPVSQPEDLLPKSPQEESAHGSQVHCWPSALPPLSEQQLMGPPPSVDLHGAFTLSNPYSNMIPVPCTSTDHHCPLEPQGSGASDQATIECQETLEAAEALMTLKNSSWNWHQSHR